jgi:hypothetical protein
MYMCIYMALLLARILNDPPKYYVGIATNKQLVKLTRGLVGFGKQTRLVVLAIKQGKLSQGLQAL